MAITDKQFEDTFLAILEEMQKEGTLINYILYNGDIEIELREMLNNDVIERIENES